MVSTDVASRPAGTLRRIAPAMWGMAVWGLQLPVAYLGGALLCRDGESATAFILVVTAVAAVAVLAGLVWSVVRLAAGGHDAEAASEDHFIHSIAVGLDLLALAAIVLGGIWAVIAWC